MANSKLSALTALAEAPADGDLVYLVDVSDTTDDAAGTSKKITASNLKSGLVAGTLVTTVGETGSDTNVPSEQAVREAITAIPGGGDVVGPATNTANYIPQWDGADSKTLKNGLALTTTLGSPGADTNIPSEKAVRAAISAAGGGDVSGPESSTDSNFALYSGESGKLLKDTGVKAADFATASHNHDGTYNNYTHPNHSGDVTSSGDGATTIANNAVTTAKIADANVTLAKIANIATARLLGRTTAGAGVVEELTSADTFVTDASTTAKGKVELAIASEVNTGTSASLAVTPDALAGSNLGIRYMSFQLNGTTALTTDDKAYQRVPAGLAGMNLVSVTGSVGTGAAGASSSGTPTFTVKNVTDDQQMLSTSLTIDASEYTSATAATAAVINTSYDDVAADDLIEVACTTAGTGTTYATVTLGFQLP